MASGRSALIVAVDEYTDAKLRKLRAPVRDADQLRRVLGDPSIGGFDVELSRNEQEPVLRERIGRFFAGRRRDDLLVLHISCHGLKDDEGHLYFAATNTQVDHLDWTAVPAEFVNRQMAKCRSRRIVLLLDCCFAGAFSRGMAARAGAGVDLKERFEGRGRAVLTASSAMEYSFEGDERSDDESPSIFTSAVVKALETGDADCNPRNGRISVDELYDYVYDEVQQRTPKQRPGKWLFDVRGDLEIARTPYSAVVEPPELPEELQAAINSPMREARLGAVHLVSDLLAGRDEGVRIAAIDALERLLEDDSRKVSEAAADILAAANAPEGLRSLEPTTRVRGVSSKAPAASDVSPAKPTAPDARRKGGVGPNFPIVGYDNLTPAQIRAQLWDLTPAELRNVHDYERRNANRGTIVTAIQSKLGGRPTHTAPSGGRRMAGVGSNFPIIGYDDLTAAQIQSRLWDLTSAERRKVRDYERRNANRETILRAIKSAGG